MFAMQRPSDYVALVTLLDILQDELLVAVRTDKQMQVAFTHDSGLF
jgi:hypothetical protein